MLAHWSEQYRKDVINGSAKEFSDQRGADGAATRRQPGGWIYHLTQYIFIHLRCNYDIRIDDRATCAIRATSFL